VDEGNPLVRTRLALHGAAEMLLAGPQYRRTGKIGLRIVPGGFATTREPAIAVAGVDLDVSGRRFALRGCYQDVVVAARLVGAGPLREVYSGSPDFDLNDQIVIDPDSARTIIAAYELGAAALGSFAPQVSATLWPEHFDVALTIDAVNYGVSPGDAGIEVPYAYVGPHAPRVGKFWNVPFGSARPMTDFANPEQLVAYFNEGKQKAAAAAKQPKPTRAKTPNSGSEEQPDRG
jgi:hypothetical protein